MLNYNPALPKQTLLQDLQIKEVKPIMKLIVRGKKREFISAIRENRTPNACVTDAISAMETLDKIERDLQSD